MKNALIALVLVSACGGGGKSAPKTPTPPSTSESTTETTPPTDPRPGSSKKWPAPPAGFAAADLIGVRGGELIAYSLADGKLVETGVAEVAKVDAEDYTSHLRAGWADRDHLFVFIPPREVVMVTADAIASVEVPEAAKFKTPRPQTDDPEGLTEGGVVEGADTGMVVADGAVWWSECPWGFPYDGWQCLGYVNARLWPPGEIAAADRGIEARAWRWTEAQPAGFVVKVKEDLSAAECVPPKGKGKKSSLRGDAEEGEKVMEARWVSADPPRLLVIYGTEGMEDLMPTRWTLHDGCAAAPVAQGTQVEVGPAGLWVGWQVADPEVEEGDDQPILRRGAVEIGPVPAGVEVVFRPPAK